MTMLRKNLTTGTQCPTPSRTETSGHTKASDALIMDNWVDSPGGQLQVRGGRDPTACQSR